MGDGLFARLLAEPGVVETADLTPKPGGIGVMAFHGGSLEVGTDTIANAVAARVGTSRYTVTLPEDLNWHIPSKVIGAERSPRLDRFLAHVHSVVTIHGYGRPDRYTTLLLGGRNRELASHLAGHLRTALPDYFIEDDLEQIPVELRGRHPDNPVNLPSGGGVQLELPPRVRGQGPFWTEHRERGEPIPHTEALVEGLVAALATA